MSTTNQNELLYRIALSMVPNIGSILIKNLIAYSGSAEEVFKASKAKLLKIPLVGEERAEAIVKADVMGKAEEELKYITENSIQPIFFTDAAYPERLKQCMDAPALMYFNGNANLNHPKIIAVVGTRRATDYGKDVTKRLIKDLAPYNPLIISGLAYGIDIAAHNAALENNLPTIAVLGGSLKEIYPQQHIKAAKQMMQNGGLLSEYTTFDEMHPKNFPERNRIVAGMCDALIIVESTADGGAVITANLAHGYNRDVFAVPGRSLDKASAGCNMLIKGNKAALIETGKDLIDAMMWEENNSLKPRKQAQRELFLSLNSEEQRVYDLLNEKGELEIDVLTIASGLSSGTLASTLLEMEMNSLIVSLPGKRYRLS